MNEVPAPSKPGRPPAVLPTTAQQTEDQVQTLLRAVNVLSSWVAEPIGEAGIEGSGPLGVRIADKNTRMAVESTLIRACNRLDTLLDDPKRWACPTMDARDLAFEHLLLQTEAYRRNLDNEAAKLLQWLNVLQKPIDPAPAKATKRKKPPGAEGAGNAVKK